MNRRDRGGRSGGRVRCRMPPTQRTLAENTGATAPEGRKGADQRKKRRQPLHSSHPTPRREGQRAAASLPSRSEPARNPGWAQKSVSKHAVVRRAAGTGRRLPAPDWSCRPAAGAKAPAPENGTETDEIQGLARDLPGTTLPLLYNGRAFDSCFPLRHIEGLRELTATPFLLRRWAEKSAFFW